MPPPKYLAFPTHRAVTLSTVIHSPPFTYYMCYYQIAEIKNYNGQKNCIDATLFEAKPRLKLTFILISRLLCPQKPLRAPKT